MTAFLKPLFFILSFLQWILSCFCFFLRGPSGEPLWPPLRLFDFPFCCYQTFCFHWNPPGAFCKDQAWNFPVQWHAYIQYYMICPCIYWLVGCKNIATWPRSTATDQQWLYLNLCYWVLHKIWSDPKIHYGTTQNLTQKPKTYFSVIRHAKLERVTFLVAF